MSRPIHAVFSALTLAAFAAPLMAQAPQGWPSPDPKMLAHANEILARVPVIDGHNDLPSELLEKFGADPFAATLREGQPKLMTDIPRLRKGHVGAQFWSAYVENDSIPTGAALRVALRQIDMAHRLVDAYPETFEFARTADDIVRIEKAGKIASLVGVEGGHAIENSLSALRSLYALGARYMTLTHNTTLSWADAAMDYSRNQGLSPFGVQVVHEMNRLGMFVDLSHVSADVMRQALQATQAPVIFSHSSARAIVDVPRNAPDDVLRMLAKNKGVIMVNFCPCFMARGIDTWNAQMDSVVRTAKASAKTMDEAQATVRAWRQQHPQPQATVGDVADHIDYIKKVAGVDVIGLGSDYDGIPNGPVGLEDVSTFPVLFAELIKRGYTDQELEKIAGLNLLRAMREMEATAARLQKSEQPGLADIPKGEMPR